MRRAWMPIWARESMAAAPISWNDSIRNSSPNPGSRLSSMASTASNVESRDVIPVPPVMMMTCTDESATASRMIRCTSAGSSRTMPAPTTRGPPALSRSRINAPLVSVSGVFVSETVNTQHPSVVGAVALCSSGVEGRVDSAAIGLIQDFHDVEHLHVAPSRAQTLLDLENAPGVRGDDGRRTGREDVIPFALEQALGHLRLGEVVDPRRSAAPV